MEVVDSIRQAYIEFVKLKVGPMDIKKGITNYIASNSFIDSKITADINRSVIDWMQCDFNFMDVVVSMKLGKVEGMEELLVFYTCFLIYLFATRMKKTMKRIYITLIGYEGEKKLPEDGHKHLTPFEINGGVTWYGGVEANIIVFRKEEMIKVLTHEMIHAFNIDAKYISEYDEMFLNDYFSIHCKSVTINESFTDALAVLINTVVFSHLKRGDFDMEFKKNLKTETAHMLKQARKILKFYGYQKVNGKLIIDRPICEKTHTISYYVVKSIVYSNFRGFCKLLQKNNMCIDSQAYIQFVRGKLETFVKNLHLQVKLTKNLKMTTLDIGENYIKLRSNRDISKRKDGSQN